MSQAITLIVYPVADLAQAKQLYNTFLGVEPYVDSPYYVGYKVGDQEIGLANGNSTGPIAYTDVADIQASLQALLDAGAQIDQDVRDVGRGLLVAAVKDVDGNVIGLRQQS